MNKQALQELWDKAVASNDNRVKDWAFEAIAEEGYDVENGVVIEPQQRQQRD